MNLIAVHSGLTAWTPGQEGRGHSHDTDTGTWSIHIWSQGRPSQHIKRWGYIEKIDMRHGRLTTFMATSHIP